MTSILEQLADAPADTATITKEDAGLAGKRLGVSAEEADGIRLSLGMHFEEIASVDAGGDDGLTVTTFDGARLVFRPTAAKDGNGNAGWLLAARPDGKADDDPEAIVYDMPVFNASGAARFGNFVEPSDPHDHTVKDGTKPDAPTGQEVSEAVDAEHAEKGETPAKRDTNRPKSDTSQSRPAKG